MADQRSTSSPGASGPSPAGAPDGGRRSLLVGAGAGIALAGLGLSARAQGAADGWPSKPVRVICNFAAGGLTDAYARQYSDALTRKFDQNFIVDNRPGAGGILGAEMVAKASPDGYTLLVTTSTPVWSARGLYRKLPYDAAKDLVPVTMFPSGALIFAANKDVPVNNAVELAEYAKTHPITLGTYGQGSWPHLVAENWIKERKIPLTIVHYKGESPMWIDIASGRIQAGIGSYLQFVSHYQKGMVRPLAAATGSVRSPKLPDVPTMVEQGFTDPLYKLDGYLPMVAPAGTPDAVLRKIADAIQEVSGTPKLAALRQAFAIDQLPPDYKTTQKLYDEYGQLWGSLAAALGIRLDA
ncbi:MAG: tripartite tricarboxylate transporter substrate binding protein [Burkholderiaceae bacterium]